MLTLQEVVSKTEAVFEQKWKIPEPPIEWKDKMLAFEEAKLDQHRDALIFDMRCWQATEMGFQKVESSQLVKLLMGTAHTETSEGPERQTHEWVYFHHCDVVEVKSSWGGKPTRYSRTERKGLWHLPPFQKKKIWECQFGKLDYLKRTIPYGVILKINECKELKLFNSFSVIAPMEAWSDLNEKKTDIDTIVVASIWEMPGYYELKPTGGTSGQNAHFFIAKW